MRFSGVSIDGAVALRLVAVLGYFVLKLLKIARIAIKLVYFVALGLFGSYFVVVPSSIRRSATALIEPVS